MLDLQPFPPGGALLEYNPYHGPDGRFSGKGGASTTVTYGGRTARGRGAAGQKAAAVSRHAAKVGRAGSMRLAQDNRANGGIGGKEQLAAGRKAAGARAYRDNRERVEQNPRAHTSSSRGGKGQSRPSAAARAALVADRGRPRLGGYLSGSSPRLRQEDTAARLAHRREIDSNATPADLWTTGAANQRGRAGQLAARRRTKQQRP